MRLVCYWPCVSCRCSFVHFLIDKSFNSIIDPRLKRTYQDMSQPLSHYFISSTHNSYLMVRLFLHTASPTSHTYAIRRAINWRRSRLSMRWHGP